MQRELEELQARLTFQDDTIQSLNNTVIHQQQEIQELKLGLEELKERLLALAESTLERSEEAPPPHY